MTRFAIAFAVLCTLLGWLFWVSPATVGRYTLDVSMVAVPAVSAMLAGQGFAWKRKLAYAGATLCLYVLASAAAVLSGFHRFAYEQLIGEPSFLLVVGVLYATFLWTFPLVMLVLFVGRNPSLLWRRRSP